MQLGLSLPPANHQLGLSRVPAEQQRAAAAGFQPVGRWSYAKQAVRLMSADIKEITRQALEWNVNPTEILTELR